MTAMRIQSIAGAVLLLTAFEAHALEYVRDFTVDGKNVRLAEGETRVDFAKIYPDDIVCGRDGTRWADIEVRIKRSADGIERLYIDQDWYGSFVLNGESYAKSINGSQAVYVNLRKGVNTLAFRSRGGCSGHWHLGLAFDTPRTPGETLAKVDFGVTRGKIRPALHSSGFGPLICSCPPKRINQLKSMNFAFARTHDWALINPNERVCDWHHIFPLKDLDAMNPAYYHFGPTDYLLKRTREETNLDVFFRLGTSIEHSGTEVHFNSLIPDDFDKVAEVFAGTIRHYNRGWANGFNWNIRYWEIWNEPDGINNMWCLPEGDGPGWGTPETLRRNVRRQELFVRFFVTVLKRLKREFPDVKVGGPAMCNVNEPYFRALLTACREANVAPDFLSWHYYGNDIEKIVGMGGRMRAICDEMGFRDCELILNEWHYLGSDFQELWSDDPAVKARVNRGPAAHNGPDSAAFTLATLARFQTSSLNQAYFYGCSYRGDWGFMDANGFLNKVYYALVAFGSIVRDYDTLGEVRTTGPVTTMVAKSSDGRRTALLVVDYRGAAGDVVLELANAPKGKPTAVIIDDARNREPVEVRLEGNRLVLPKTGPASASYLVTFDPQVESATEVK